MHRASRLCDWGWFGFGFFLVAAFPPYWMLNRAKHCLSLWPASWSGSKCEYTPVRCMSVVVVWKCLNIAVILIAQFMVMQFSSQAAQTYCLCCSILGIPVFCWSRKVLSTLWQSWNWLETDGIQWDFQAQFRLNSDSRHPSPCHFLLLLLLDNPSVLPLYCTTSSAPFLLIHEPSWLRALRLLLVRLAALHPPPRSLGQTFLPLHLQALRPPDDRSSRGEMENSWRSRIWDSLLSTWALCGCLVPLRWLGWGDSKKWFCWENLYLLDWKRSELFNCEKGREKSLRPLFSRDFEWG